MLRLVCLTLIVPLSLLASAPASAQDAAPGVAVLGNSSYWRTHYTIMHPVYLKGDTLTKIPVNVARSRSLWMAYPTVQPAKDWASPDFDDSGWTRTPGFLTTFAKHNEAKEDMDTKSPFIGLECLRGKFAVADPAKAGGMVLEVEYRGGLVVYVNGKEVARGHLAKTSSLDTLAEPTQAGEKPPRRLANVTIPANLLKKGVNVLAIECHRAPYFESEVVMNLTKWPMGILFPRASCGVESVRLTAPAGAEKAVMANTARPEGLQVWNSDPVATDFDMDWGDPNETLRPIRLAGARNGVFSGKVLVGSTQPIRGIKTAVSALASRDGKNTIPAKAVTVRFSTPNGVEGAAETRYVGPSAALRMSFARARSLAAQSSLPQMLGALQDKAPALIPVVEKSKAKRTDGAPIVPGAVLAVWATIAVPADAAPGDYAGTLTVSADGLAPVAVPLSLTVSAWKLPNREDYRSFLEVVESPESLAMAYDVPLWSDKHFALIETTFRHIAHAGNKVVYLPLICQTNLGNEQSLVRWRKAADGTFTPDFTIFDRYLDAVEKGMGKPQVVILYMWDSFLDRTLGGRNDEKWEPDEQKADLQTVKGHGPEVTVVDADGQISTREMPVSTSPDAVAAWEPITRGIKERLAQRGLMKAAHLGMMCDYMPTQESATRYAEMYPGLPWASMSHFWPKPFFGHVVDYKANVFTGDDGYRDPAEHRALGWTNAEIRSHFPRLLRDFFPTSTFRLAEETALLTNYRGVVRLGADFWQVMKNRRGDLVGAIAGRYPKSMWHNLNIEISLLAQGPDGPIATTHLEAIREGIQECEARIVIERALNTPDLRAKLGDETAVRLQALLDERSRQARHGTSTLAASGSDYPQWAWNSDVWWQRPGVGGHLYFIGSGWQQRSLDLFNAAAEVESKVGVIAPSITIPPQAKQPAPKRPDAR